MRRAFPIFFVLLLVSPIIAIAEETTGDPYTLPTCPVSDQKLGSMGEPVKHVVDGREVRFCCGGCISTFEGDPQKYLAKVDKALAEDQEPHYPLKSCPVTGKPLDDNAVDAVVGNRLFRTCCPKCPEAIQAAPAKHVAELDAAVAQAQKEDYPLETCPVSGAKLGEMGEPVDVVIANRLVRLCCGGCKGKIEAEPVKYIQQVDAAREETPATETEG